MNGFYKGSIKVPISLEEPLPVRVEGFNPGQETEGRTVVSGSVLPYRAIAPRNYELYPVLTPHPGGADNEHNKQILIKKKLYSPTVKEIELYGYRKRIRPVSELEVGGSLLMNIDGWFGDETIAHESQLPNYPAIPDNATWVRLFDYALPIPQIPVNDSNPKPIKAVLSGGGLHGIVAIRITIRWDSNTTSESNPTLYSLKPNSLILNITEIL